MFENILTKKKAKKQKLKWETILYCNKLTKY